MVDTIVLNIPRPYKKIQKRSLFSPNLKILYDPKIYESPNRFCAKYTLPKAISAEDEYMPQLTFISIKLEVGRKDMLLIQFSAPKLLFGNNLEEVSEDDFPKLVELLHQKLKKMGVTISQDELISAKVSRIDPSKNIIIDTPVSQITQQIGKIDIDLRMKMGYKDYANEGSELYFKSKSYCVSFYDKGPEIYSKMQPEYFKNRFFKSALHKQLKKNEKYIFRMELRFGRDKLAKVCKEYGIERNEVILKNFFQKQICRQIILDHWQKYTKDISLLTIDLSNCERIFIGLRKIKQSMSTSVALRLMMTMHLIQKCGFRSVRKLFGYTGEFNKNSSWSRLRKELKIFQKLCKVSVKEEFQNIGVAIEEFQALRLENFE